MIKNHNYWGLLLLVLGIITACSSTSDIHSGRFTDLYENNDIDFKPYFKLQKKDGKTDLYFQFSSDELLYERDFDANRTLAKLEVKATLFDGFSLENKLDSVKTDVVDQRIDERKRYISGTLSIPFRLNYQNVLECSAIDKNRNLSFKVIVPIDTNVINSSNYYVSRELDGFPILTEYLTSDMKLKISSYLFTGNSISIESFESEFDLPPPPFSLKKPKAFNFDPIESETSPRSETGDYLVDPFKKELFSITDQTTGAVFAMPKFPKGYPKISSHDQMIQSLRYITTSNEYDDLVSASDKKEALDNFWLDRSGSKERAREVIKEYYSRAEHANYYFSSHVEGWKTDRGLIYMIFGEPKFIYKTMYSEVWTYGEEGKYRSLSFRFSKVKNPFSDSDYRLVRKEEYKPIWYFYVDAWRTGKILN